MSRWSRTVLWIVLALLLAACASPARTTGQSTGSDAPRTSPAKRITLAVYGELVSMRSQVQSTSPGVVEIEQVVNAGLATVDDRGLLRARMAENVPSVENGLWK